MQDALNINIITELVTYNYQYIYNQMNRACIIIVFDLMHYCKHCIQCFHIYIHCFDYSMSLCIELHHISSIYSYLYLVLIFELYISISYMNIIQSKSISKIINIIMCNGMIADFHNIARFLFLNKPIKFVTK